MSEQPVETAEAMVPMSQVNQIIHDMQLSLDTRTRAVQMAMQSNSDQKDPKEIVKSAAVFEGYLISGADGEVDNPLTQDTSSGTL